MANQDAPVPLVLRKRGMSTTMLTDTGTNCHVYFQMGMSIVYIVLCMNPF